MAKIDRKESEVSKQEVLDGLARVRMIFQQRTIVTAMGINPDAKPEPVEPAPGPESFLDQRVREYLKRAGVKELD